MSWILLTVAAVACRGAYGVLSKVMSRRVEVSSAGQSMLLLVVATPLAIAASPVLGGLSTEGIAEEAYMLLALVSSSTVGGLLYFHGLRRLGAGVAQIAFSSVLIWGAAFSVLLLDSRFSLVQVGGAALLMGAIWLAQYERGERINGGIFYMLMAAMCFGLFQVSSAAVSQSLTVATSVLIAYLGTAVFTLALLGRPIIQDFKATKGRRLDAILSTAPAAITSVGYYIFAFLAYRSAPDAGVVVLLLTTQVIVGLLLAMVFLGERRHVRRTLAAGVLAVVAGIAIKS